MMVEHDPHPHEPAPVIDETRGLFQECSTLYTYASLHERLADFYAAEELGIDIEAIEDGYAFRLNKASESTLIYAVTKDNRHQADSPLTITILSRPISPDKASAPNAYSFRWELIDEPYQAYQLTAPPNPPIPPDLFKQSRQELAELRERFIYGSPGQEVELAKTPEEMLQACAQAVQSIDELCRSEPPLALWWQDTEKITCSETSEGGYRFILRNSEQRLYTEYHFFNHPEPAGASCSQFEVSFFTKIRKLTRENNLFYEPRTQSMYRIVWEPLKVASISSPAEVPSPPLTVPAARIIQKNLLTIQKKLERARNQTTGLTEQAQ